MTQTYRTDDLTKWGTGKGSNLTPAEVDNNFWTAIQRLVTLEARPGAAAAIDHFAIVGTNLYVYLTDSTVKGPYALPPAPTFNARGDWQPTTSYAVLDTVTANGGLYVVIFAHTSAGTFSAGANDGAGHNYYSLMLQTPGSSLPTGGATGQVLQKTSSTNYATTWGNKLPTGGTARQYLIKVNSTQDNAAWSAPQATDINFTPATGSALSASNVDDAIDQLEGLLTSGGIEATNVNFTPATGSTLTATDVDGALDQLDSANIKAITADYLDNATGKVLTTDKVWGAAALVALTDATTIAVDMSTFINASVTLAGNRTLGNPSNTKSGQSGVVKIVQDSTGSRTLAYASNWKFAAGTPPTLTTAANAVDLLYYQVISSTFIYATLIKGVS